MVKVRKLFLISLVVILLILFISIRQTPIGIGVLIPHVLAQSVISQACPNGTDPIAALTFRTLSDKIVQQGCYDTNGNLYIGTTAYISPVAGGAGVQAVFDLFCSNLQSGQKAYVSIIATPGTYIFNSPATTQNYSGFCRVEIWGQHVSGVAGTIFQSSNRTIDILHLQGPDSVSIHHILFSGDTVNIATATNTAITLGVAGGQTLFDAYLDDLWIVGFNKGINCVNCSGISLIRNTIEINNFGFWCNPAATDTCSDVIFDSDRWFNNGIGIADGGAIRCENTNGASKVGIHNITGGIFDGNGNFNLGTSGYAIKLINNCNAVNITGAQFNTQTYDDINITKSQDIAITGNTQSNTQHLFLDCFDCQGVGVAANSFGKTDISNAVPHSVIYFQKSSGTSANNVVDGNVSSFTGSTTATTFLATDVNTTNTTATANLYPAISILALYSGVLDTTASIFGLTKQYILSGGSNTPSLCAGDGNSIPSSDKEVCMSYNISGDSASIVAVHNGNSWRPLGLNNVSGAGGLGGIQLGLSTFAQLGTPTNGTFVYCSDCTIANPCANAGTGALAKRLNGVWVCN